MPPIPLPDPPLADGSVALRPWTPDDVPGLVEACSDPEIGRWTHVPYPYGDQDAREFVAGSDLTRRAGRELALAIVSARDGRLLGSVGLSKVSFTEMTGEVGYWVCRQERGRGAGTRAVRLLSAWALRELGLERLELLANPENEASQRLARRAGYTREGVLRLYRRRKGRREDLVMFSRLAGE